MKKISKNRAGFSKPMLSILLAIVLFVSSLSMGSVAEGAGEDEATSAPETEAEETPAEEPEEESTPDPGMGSQGEPGACPTDGAGTGSPGEPGADPTNGAGTGSPGEPGAGSTDGAGTGSPGEPGTDPTNGAGTSSPGEPGADPTNGAGTGSLGEPGAGSTDGAGTSPTDGSGAGSTETPAEPSTDATDPAKPSEASSAELTVGAVTVKLDRGYDPVQYTNDKDVDELPERIITIQCNVDGEVSLPKPDRVGYIFTGWMITSGKNPGRLFAEDKYTVTLDDCVTEETGNTENTEETGNTENTEETGKGEYVITMEAQWEAAPAMLNASVPADVSYGLEFSNDTMPKGWELKYTDLDGNNQTIQGGGSTADKILVKQGTEVALTLEPDKIALTFKFKDGEGKDQAWTESLVRLAKNEANNPSDGFTCPEVKEQDGSYTFVMPESDVAISSVWELYLDKGTIELFPEGFQQKEVYSGDSGDNKVSWEGGYRILQCADANLGIRMTSNRLKLYGDLQDRKISLGDLNIDKKDSIELMNKNPEKGEESLTTNATLTQEGNIQAKNILVPEGTSLTVKGLYDKDEPDDEANNKKSITLMPDAGRSAIGAKKDSYGNVTIKNSKIIVEKAEDLDESDTMAVDGDNVEVTGSSLGTDDNPLPFPIHAKSKLVIGNTTDVYQ